MANKYDAENLLADIKALLVANLNAAIAAVEAEKVSQGLPVTNLLPVDTTSGYFVQSWGLRNLNQSPAIWYGVEELKTEGIGPYTKETYKIFVELVLIDTMQDALVNFRTLRYSRALRDVFEKNYDQLPSASQIKIETVHPISFKLDNDSSEEVHICGVSVTTTLA